MKIHGIQGMTPDQINFEIQRGGRFIRYLYCVSILVLTFKRSEIYLIKAGESAVSKGLGFAALSFLAGWWGLPWGPIYTIQSLITNFRGGDDITAQVWAPGQQAPKSSSATAQ